MPARPHRQRLPARVPESARVPSRRVTAARALQPGTLRRGAGSEGAGRPRPPGPHPAPAYLAAVVIVQGRQAGRLGPGPRAHRGRRGVQADVHGGRGGGGGGSRGQCLGGRRVGASVRAGVRARGAGRGRRPGSAPPPPARPPARARYCSGRGRRGGPGAWARGKAAPAGPAAAGSPARLSAPAGPGGWRARPDGPFPSRLPPPRVRGGRKPSYTPPQKWDSPRPRYQGVAEPGRWQKRRNTFADGCCVTRSGPEPEAGRS